MQKSLLKKKVSFFVKVYFYLMCMCFACIYICVVCACLVALEARKEC